MFITSKTISAALIALMVSGCGFGHRGGHGHHGKHGGMMFSIMSEVDADGSGSVSQAEVDAYRAAKVRAADGSRDGNLTLDEFETLFAELVRERMVDAFQRLDDDGNGVITGAEMDERFGDIVAHMDRDDDGELSRKDFRGRR